MKKTPVELDKFRDFSMFMTLLAAHFGVLEDDEVRHKFALLKESIDRKIAQKEEFQKTGRSLKRNFVPIFIKIYGNWFDKNVPGGYNWERKLNPVEQNNINTLGLKLLEIHSNIEFYLKWFFEEYYRPDKTKVSPNIGYICCNSTFDAFRVQKSESIIEHEKDAIAEEKVRDLYERLSALGNATKSNKYAQMFEMLRNGEITFDQVESLVVKDEKIVFS